jgi:uncharacterized protein YijF (DUF1287 family)
VNTAVTRSHRTSRKTTLRDIFLENIFASFSETYLHLPEGWFPTGVQLPMHIQSCWKSRFVRVVLSLCLMSAALGQATPRLLFLQRLSSAAIERSHHNLRYDPAYVRISYPGGDVPADTGVCTDEVIRAYRALDIDLQKEVHQDMAVNFSAYTGSWFRKTPDPNIDHRRVPNLRVFFSRKGDVLPVTGRAEDYAPGDLVTWGLGHGLTHIGIVVDRKDLFGRRYMIMHNIGAGPKIEDVLFDWKITGHYRYFGPDH